MQAFYAMRAIPGLEQVTDTSCCRSIETQQGPACITVSRTTDEAALTLQLSLDPGVELPSIKHKARQMFDLDLKPELINAAFAADPKIGPLIQRWPGIRLPRGWDPYEIAIRGIIGQQVTVRAANTVVGRLVRAYGAECSFTQQAGITHLFPRPDCLAEAPLELLGMPGKRAETLRELSRRVQSQQLQLEPNAMPLDALSAELLSIPGIGPWTLHYILMRAIAVADAFPNGDIGMLRGASEPGQARLSTKALQKMAEAWRPYRAYAGILLWREDARRAALSG